MVFGKKLFYSSTLWLSNLFLILFLAMGSANTSIGSMLLELCVTELEDTTNSTQTLTMTSHPVVQESSHPYVDDVTLRGIFFC